MSEPQRLHPAAAILMALRIARELAVPALLPLVFRLFREGRAAVSLETALLAAVLALLFLAASGSYGVLAWRRYTYRVEAGELRVEQGVISRQRRYIPLERIQSVDLTQGVLQRLLGITSIRVETAGGGNARPEVFLPGVSRRDGEILRQALARQPTTTLAGAEEAGGRLVRRLPVGDLLLAGSTSGRAGVALSIIASVMTIADDALPLQGVTDLSDRLSGIGVVAALGLLIAMLIWLLGVLGTVLAHAGFSLTRDGNTLLIERGLLERRRATIPIDRIQAVRIVEGIVRQPFGLVELRVESAGFGRTAGESAVLFPLLRRDDILPLLRDMAPSFATQATLRRLPRRSMRRYALRPTLLIWPAVVSGIVSVAFFPAGLGALLLVPGAALLGAWQYHDAGWAVQGDILLIRERPISRTTAIVPRRRVQLGQIRRTPFQQRVGLASFSVRVASGAGGTAFGLLHMDAEDAAGLLSWLSPASRLPQDRSMCTASCRRQ